MARGKKPVKINHLGVIDFNKPNYKDLLARECSHLHYELDTKERRESTIKWAKEHGKDVKALNKLSDYDFDVVGKYCYIMNNGGVLDPKLMSSLDRQFDTLIESVKKKKEPTQTDEPKKNVVGIQEYLEEHASTVCSIFDGWVDQFMENPKFEFDLKSIKGIFQSNNFKTGHYRFVNKFYESAYKEMKDLLHGDEDLKEGYSYLTKPQMKKLHAFYEELLSTANFLKNSGTAKKPRKKKAVDVAKLVSKLVYKKQDGDLISVNPVHIVGAKELWVYNIKTRKLGVYYTLDDAGLTLKGSAIKNFSEKSVEKTIRKGSKLNLKTFITGGKVAKKNAFKDVNSMEIKLKGRINEHCILLCVEK